MINEEQPGKKKQITQAAEKLFNEKGYYQVKVSEIAEKAGVGKGTVYEYFASKEDLFNQMLKEGAVTFKESITRGLQEPGDIWDKLRAALLNQADLLWENREVAGLVLRSDFPGQKELMSWLLSVREKSLLEIQNAIREAVKRKEINDVDPFLAALMFRGISIEVIASYILLEKKKPDDKIIDAVIRHFRHGFA